MGVGGGGAACARGVCPGGPARLADHGWGPDGAMPRAQQAPSAGSRGAALPSGQPAWTRRLQPGSHGQPDSVPSTGARGNALSRFQCVNSINRVRDRGCRTRVSWRGTRDWKARQAW